MKRFLYSLLLIAILVPQVSLAADSYGWSKFFTVPGSTGSTQYYSKVFATAAECTANEKLSGAELRLPTGAARDASKPVVCSCANTLASQGASCDVAKFNGAQVALREAQGGTAPTAPTTPQVQAPTSIGFVPLTSIPGIESAGNSATLPDFLNSLYKLAIGVAAVLAVLQIVRAGIMYMGGDSVTEKKEAKSLIALSIGGLILILSPVIVFSIINPKILELKIDGLDALGTSRFSGDTTGFSGSDAVLWVDSADRDDAIKRCTEAGGLISHACVLKSDNTVSRAVPGSEACKPEETGRNVCRAKPGSPTTADACTVQYASIQAAGSGGVCDASRNYSTIPNGCCTGASAGTVCCGSLKRTDETVDAQYGWKAWFNVPNAAGQMVSTLYKSVLFGTKEACSANLADSDTFKNLPVGSKFDTKKGTNGYACLCTTPLSQQAQECKDFASTGLSAPKTGGDPTAGPDVTKIIDFSYYLYVPLLAGEEFDGPVAKDKTAYNEFKTACEARRGVFGHSSNGTYRDCSGAELAGYSGAASRKSSLKCVDGKMGCNLR